MISILSDHQKTLLRAIANQKLLADSFYFGGGTVLSEYYLHHRFSEDLDFFCEQEFDPISITAILKNIQRLVGASDMRYEQSFNRNLFFMTSDEEEIKLEFTFYPFPRIEKGGMREGLPIDSLKDIAVNKVFTIYQKPRSRDFIDLYCILQKEHWSFGDLVSLAQIKFDTYLDPVQVGAQLVRVKELKDYPRMILDIKPGDWEPFFIEEAKSLGSKVLE